jgi:hypothetical protein
MTFYISVVSTDRTVQLAVEELVSWFIWLGNATLLACLLVHDVKSNCWFTPYPHIHIGFNMCTDYYISSLKVEPIIYRRGYGIICWCCSLSCWLVGTQLLIVYHKHLWLWFLSYTQCIIASKVCIYSILAAWSREEKKILG